MGRQEECRTVPGYAALSHAVENLHRADRDLYRHFQEVVGTTVIGAGDGDGLTRFACHGDRHQVMAAMRTVGRIEFGPAGPGQIHLDPGMSGAGADGFRSPDRRSRDRTGSR